MFYRLFMLDARDRIVGPAEMLDADCDLSAITQAEAYPHPYAMELWAGERLVRLFEREGPGRLKA
jgi:hypothetical protein